MTYNFAKPQQRRLLYIAITILTFFLFFGGPDYYSARSFKEFLNLGHILCFSLLVVLSFTFTKKLSEKFYVKCLYVLLTMLVWGGLVELMQANFQRTPDIGDLFRNLIGCFVGLFFLLKERKTIKQPILRIVQTVIVFLVAFQLYPVIAAVADEHLERQHFPTLSDFETPFELSRWEGNQIVVEDKIHFSGKHSMRVTLNTDLYSGVGLKYFPGNWEGTKKFHFSVYNPENEPLEITCRIHDRKHIEGEQLYSDRFNRAYSLHRGWNTIEIDIDDIRSAPKGREMDMGHIKGVGFFAMRLPSPRVIWIDDVRLVRLDAGQLGWNCRKSACRGVVRNIFRDDIGLPGFV